MVARVSGSIPKDSVTTEEAEEEEEVVVVEEEGRQIGVACEKPPRVLLKR